MKVQLRGSSLYEIVARVGKSTLLVAMTNKTVGMSVLKPVEYQGHFSHLGTHNLLSFDTVSIWLPVGVIMGHCMIGHMTERIG